MLAIRSGARRPRGAIGVHAPGKEPLIWILLVRDERVCVRPVPKGIELTLLVHLNRDHHSIAYALGSSIVIGPIRDVREWSVLVRTGFEVDTFGHCVAMEQLLESLLDLGARLFGRVPLFLKEVAIIAGRISAPTVSWMRND